MLAPEDTKRMDIIEAAVSGPRKNAATESGFDLFERQSLPDDFLADQNDQGQALEGDDEEEAIPPQQWDFERRELKAGAAKMAEEEREHQMREKWLLNRVEGQGPQYLKQLREYQVLRQLYKSQGLRASEERRLRRVAQTLDEFKENFDERFKHIYLPKNDGKTNELRLEEFHRCKQRMKELEAQDKIKRKRHKENKGKKHVMAKQLERRRANAERKRTQSAQRKNAMSAAN